MQQISLDDLDDRWEQVEEVVDNTPEIDRWCSGPDWAIPVATSFAPTAERLIFASAGGDGFVLLSKYHEASTTVLGGIEPLWGFGTPVLGSDPRAVALELADELSARHDWQALFLTGMPLTEDPRSTGGETLTLDRNGLTFNVAMGLSSLGVIRLTEGITRQIIDLTDGYERWLASRSQRFRRNLRRAADGAERAGLTIHDVSDEPDLFDRLTAIERCSWKGAEGTGITSPEMSLMYRSMIKRLSDRQRLHAHVATIGSRDVGYILGGIRQERYRGLQLSYVSDADTLSIGHLLQDHQLRILASQRLAHTYDLGMDFGYKRRWADHAETSLTMVVDRH